jgi:superfamily II DNA or RNA helicase
MQFTIESATRAYAHGNFTNQELEALKKELSYTNTAAAHDVKRHYSNQWLRRKDPDGWDRKLEELQSKVKNTLVFEEEHGIYVRPSSLKYLHMPVEIVKNKIIYKEPKAVAWQHTLPFMLYPYQVLSVQNLLKEKHANVELCTGAGKSAIILKLCRDTGFQTAIVAPSKSIFNELLEKFEYYLGRGNVGAFGDGKKKIGKLFTVCIADSLVNVKRDTPEWEFFSNLDMLIVDESHTWGADTLEDICNGIFSKVPYRFFMSGTQSRGDGTLKLLQSIIGPTVFTLSTKDAVSGGFICPHEYRIVKLESSNPNYNSNEPLEMKRIHFLNNRNIAAFIAKLANAEGANGRQTLVLVEELSQISLLKKLLKVPYAYAHSEKTPKRLLELGLEKVDTKEVVEKFNQNQVKVLIGTSCIATGTNIYPTHSTVNWVGGASEIKTKQGAVGRSVRLHDQNPHKEKCVKKTKAYIYDFDVYDIETMRRHLEDRLSCYHESGSEIKRINLSEQKIQAGGVR